MYQNLAQLLAECEERNISLWRAIIDNEIEISEVSENEIYALLRERYAVMNASARKALDRPLETPGNLISGVARTQHQYAGAGGLCGGLINRVMAMALSSSEVNASMGRICAAPTAGACGVLPAVLIGLEEALGLDETTVLNGLATASGIGAIMMKNATVAGAEGGCQAECGVAAAMAAAAAVQMSGGSPRAALEACSLALINMMGLVCDPVAGMVQVPCAQRNASQAVNALLSADMALAGNTCIIPPDEVVDALYRVGRMLPEALRETSEGGIAASPTGKRIACEMLGT